MLKMKIDLKRRLSTLSVENDENDAENDELLSKTNVIEKNVDFRKILTKD